MRQVRMEVEELRRERCRLREEIENLRQERTTIQSGDIDVFTVPPPPPVAPIAPTVNGKTRTITIK